MQDIQPLGFLPGEQRRYDRIGHRLHDPVADRQNERAHVQRPVPVGQDEQDGGTGLTEEREHHRPAVADVVYHEAEQDDADGKRPDPDAKYFAFLRLREVECLAPFVDDEGPHDEPERRCHHRGKAAPEQQFVTGHFDTPGP